MDSIGLALSVMFLLNSHIDAQHELDRHLVGWEQFAKQAKSCSLKFDLIRAEAAFKKQRKFSGEVSLLQPKMVRLNLRDEKQTSDEGYLYDGRSLLVYDYVQKIVVEFSSQMLVADCQPCDLLVGMSAEDAKKRFRIKLQKSDSDQRIVLELRPTSNKDEQEFHFVRVTLRSSAVKSPLLPYSIAKLEIEKPNGDFETFTFREQILNPKELTPKSFEFTQPGEGWTVQRLPRKP